MFIVKFAKDNFDFLPRNLFPVNYRNYQILFIYFSLISFPRPQRATQHRITSKNAKRQVLFINTCNMVKCVYSSMHVHSQKSKNQCEGWCCLAFDKASKSGVMDERDSVSWDLSSLRSCSEWWVNNWYRHLRFYHSLHFGRSVSHWNA